MILANQAITLVSSWIDHRFVPLLVDSAFKSFVLLALAYAATRLMRNRSAALRHLIWYASAMLPILIVTARAAALALVANAAGVDESERSIRRGAPMPAAWSRRSRLPMDAMSQQAPSPRPAGFRHACLHRLADRRGAVSAAGGFVAQIRLWRFLRRCRDASETRINEPNRVHQP